MLDHPDRPIKILIVDDEATLIFFLKQSLREIHPNCIVDAAASGEEAITKLTYTPYDLLITDLKMPGISGFTLAEISKSMQPHIKIIIMTAFGSYAVNQQVKQLNVDGYLIKPFPTQKLQDLATNILSLQHHPSAPTAPEY